MPLMKGTELADRVQAVPSGRAFMAKYFDLDTLEKRVRETLARPSAFARSRKV